MVITAINSLTPVGLDAETTAASVRAGISRLAESRTFCDSEANLITEARIPNQNYELDEIERMREITSACLEGLFQRYPGGQLLRDRKSYLLLGTATPGRPGPRYAELINNISTSVQMIIGSAHTIDNMKLFASGNAATIKALLEAQQLLNRDPHAFCIIGGFDSLLAMDTLEWLEESERLKSESFGRNQALVPAEACGFLIVESEEMVARNKINALATILGSGYDIELAPFVSLKPCRGDGLTKACKQALAALDQPPQEIRTIVADLSGEFYHAKVWNYVEMRCFVNSANLHHLWCPAEYMGSIGAASGAILLSIATSGLNRGWIQPQVLVTCLDDEGECGTCILSK